MPIPQGSGTQDSLASAPFGARLIIGLPAARGNRAVVA
jgi:hypothetical protein